MSQSDDPSPPDVVTPVRRGGLGSFLAPDWTKPRIFRHHKLGRVLLRLLVWGTVAGVIAVVLLLNLLNSAVTPIRLRRAIVGVVAEQTGGRLDIGQVECGLFSGVRLHDVSFYPPLEGDTRGAGGGGEVAKAPLIQLKLLRFEYSTRQLMAGYLHLSALQLVEPAVTLVKQGGHFNFESILAFRHAHFPQVEAQPPPEVKKAERPGDLIPVDPGRISMPIRLLLQDIGIQDLRLDLTMDEDPQAATPAQHISLTGLSLDVGVQWYKRDSDIWVSMLSPLGKPLMFHVDKATAVGKPLKRSITIEQPLALRLDVLGLKRLNFDLIAKVAKLSSPAATYHDLDTSIRMRLGLTEDLKGLKVDGINIDLADALSYEFVGLIGIPDASMQRFDLHLSQELQIDLAEVAKLGRPFVPGLTAAGEIALEDFTIDGSIEPAKLTQPTSEEPVLPNVSMKLALRDIKGNLPGLNLDMEPLNSEISLAIVPAFTGKGSQVDLGVDFDAPKVMIKKDTPFGSVTAGVQGLVTKVTGRLLWPEKVAPVFKVDVQADRVLAYGPKIAKVDVPLSIDIDAQGHQDLSRLALRTNAELTGLASFGAAIECQNACQQLKAQVDAGVESFAKVHAMMVAMADTLKLGPFMPTSLQGSAKFAMRAHGNLPDPLKIPPAELVKNADVQFDTNFELQRVGVKLPFDDLKLDNASTRFAINGDLHAQHIVLKQTFSQLKLAHAKPDAPALPINVRDFEFATTVNNKISGSIDIDLIPELMTKIATDVETKLNIAQVQVEGTLPRPLNNFAFSTKLQQSGLQDIRIKEFVVKIPDFGANVTMTAATKVDNEFLPKSLDLNLRAYISHAGDESLPGDMKTSGKADFDLRLASKDMKDITVDGKAKFDHFYVAIPAKEVGKPPTLVVEDIVGEIPFKQGLALPDLREVKKKAAEQKLTAAKKPIAAPTVAESKLPSKPEVPTIEVAEDTGRIRSSSDSSDQAMEKSMDRYLKKNDNRLPADANIVAMVDYTTIKPFYPDRRPLSIRRIDVANLEMSHMEFDMELKQSLFALNQFMIDFLGGKIEGDFKLAFDTTEPDPKKIPKKMWTSLHMTRLDTRKLIERFPNLKSKAASWDLFSNPYIDATIHILFDINSSDVAGDIEISSIGKEQLKMMLFYVDPYEQNPTIRDIRGALNLGEVRRVSIPLRNGEVGMDVDVRVLAAPIPTPKLQHFPIRQILENFKDQSKAG